MLEAEERVLDLQLKGFAVESTVRREGGEQVDGEELAGEVDCGGRRTAGRKRRWRREGRRVSERGKERAKRRGELFRSQRPPSEEESCRIGERRRESPGPSVEGEAEDGGGRLTAGEDGRGGVLANV